MNKMLNCWYASYQPRMYAPEGRMWISPLCERTLGMCRNQATSTGFAGVVSMLSNLNVNIDCWMMPSMRDVLPFFASGSP